MKNCIKKIIRKNNFVYTNFIRFSTKEYKINFKEFRAYKHENPDKVKREMTLLRNYWKCYPTQYIRHRLLSQNLSDEELLDYVPAYIFAVKHLDKKHKGIDIDKIEPKLAQYKLFIKKNIPTPEILGLIKNATVKNLDNNTIEIDDILNLIGEKDKLFIKPFEGAGGKGICVLEKIENSIFINKKEVKLQNLLSSLEKKEDYIIQRGIIQRSDISLINASSVNTLRVIAQERDGVMDMRACVMRIGRNKSFVDNSAQGGISVKIDIETGEMNKFATAEHGVQSYFKTHPDTNFVFEGTIIKDWYKIKSQISDICNKLSEFKDIALDIAITDNEVELIELNFKYGIDHLQTSCGGMRRVLNIYPVKI